MGKLHFQASVGFAGGEQTKDYVRGFSNLNLVRKIRTLCNSMNRLITIHAKHGRIKSSPSSRLCEVKPYIIQMSY